MSAQAVGGAVGHNSISLIIPCHRVVGADGSLTGYAGGIEKEIKLLETGIPVVLENWMEHTHTPDDIQNTIIARIQEDIQGGAKTGFYPYYKDGKIQFDQRWRMIVGKMIS